MKSIFAFVSLACAVAAIPAQLPLVVNEPIDTEFHVDGFDINLNSRRLVQMEGQPPVWMTELDKASILSGQALSQLTEFSTIQIEAKAQGLKFFDVSVTSHVPFVLHSQLSMHTCVTAPMPPTWAHLLISGCNRVCMPLSLNVVPT